MKENRLDGILEILERKKLHSCVLRGMDNIFYLTGFRGSEGTVLVTKGDVVLLTDSRYTTYAREVAEGCTVLETSGRNGTLAGLLRDTASPKRALTVTTPCIKLTIRGRNTARMSSSYRSPTISSR